MSLHIKPITSKLHGGTIRDPQSWPVGHSGEAAEPAARLIVLAADWLRGHLKIDRDILEQRVTRTTHSAASHTGPDDGQEQWGLSKGVPSGTCCNPEQ